MAFQSYPVKRSIERHAFFPIGAEDVPHHFAFRAPAPVRAYCLSQDPKGLRSELMLGTRPN